MKKKYYKQFIRCMSRIFAENRTDVSEMCMAMLQAKTPYDYENLMFHLDDFQEARYVRATVKGIPVMYDTLTTEIEYFDAENGEWDKAENHEYEKD